MQMRDVHKVMYKNSKGSCINAFICDYLCLLIGQTSCGKCVRIRNAKNEDYISSLCSRYAHEKKVVQLPNDNHLRSSFDMGACLSDVNKYKRLYIETSF